MKNLRIRLPFLIGWRRPGSMIDKPRDARDHAGSQNLPVDSEVKLTVTVWTGCEGVVHGVRSPFGKRSNVMDLQELIAIGATEWCGFFADFTCSIRPFENPGDYVWVAHKPPHRSKCLFAYRGPWRRRESTRRHA